MKLSAASTYNNPYQPIRMPRLPPGTKPTKFYMVMLIVVAVVSALNVIYITVRYIVQYRARKQQQRYARIQNDEPDVAKEETQTLYDPAQGEQNVQA